MKIGDKVRVSPYIGSGPNSTVEATVVYIHPKRRYYTVEYKVHPDGPPLRESFAFQHRRGED